MRTLVAVSALAVIASCCFASDAEELARLEADFEREQQSVEAALHAPLEWKLLATLHAPGKVVVADTPKGISAIRVEVTRVDATPKDGRAFIGEFQCTSAGQVLRMSRVTADAALHGFPAEAASDGDVKSAWGVVLDAPHAVVFELAARRGVAEEVTFALVAGVAESAPFQARIFATTSEPPVCELPDGIRAILALEPSERTASQRAEMTAFLCKLSKQLAQAQAELAEKRTALKK